MKNLRNTTVNSLFNSIPKIVSLIVLLFILLFSISCKSNENPRKVLYKVSDIEGTWRSPNSSEFFFTINGNGYINFKTSQGISSAYISGWDRNLEILEGDEKLEIYIQVSLTAGGEATLTLRFNSASNCTALLLGETETFTKQ